MIKLSELNFEEYGTWPKSIKFTAAALVMAVLILVGVWFDILPQKEELVSLQTEMATLKKDFEKKQAKAVSLKQYQEQMEKMHQSLGELLLLLPEESEVPGLVEDISQQGIAAGLEIQSMRLMPEKQIDFYVELPIEIEVVGTYHELSNFVSNVASLSRIVTLHDFFIQLYSDKKAGSKIEITDLTDPLLMMHITAKTYRYNTKMEESK